MPNNFLHLPKANALHTLFHTQDVGGKYMAGEILLLGLLMGYAPRLGHVFALTVQRLGENIKSMKKRK
jgi:hypothetical protein